MMKKVFIPLLFFCIYATMANGQNWRFGIKAGLAFANQSIDDPNVISTNSLTTYAIHAVARYKLNTNYYFQGALGFIGKGVVTYENAQTNSFKLVYLDLPLDLLYKVELPKLGNIFFGVGPYLSLGRSGVLQSQDPNSPSNESLDFGSTQDYKRLDTGLNFASSLELNNNLTVNMNYELGLNNLTTESEMAVNVNTIKNRVFSVGLGLMF